MIRRLVLASGNSGKLREFRRLLTPLGIEVIAQAELGIAETGEPHHTFVENALTKARHASSLAHLPALADDSGICVDALNGAPGVRSARYAGDDATYTDNVMKLLDALSDLPEPEDRLARFRTVVLVCFPDGREVTAAGWVDGAIALGPRGHNGFGYDPVFEPIEGDGRTFGELTAEEKNGVSHRARALRALAELLHQ